MNETDFSALRIGHGYDVHRFCDNRTLVLGGVAVPYEKGLAGHSDADVLTHALADALLGAAGLRDIGSFFPDRDPAYEGISSLILLKKAMEYVERAGFVLINADCTVVAQAPKLSSHISAMKETLAKTLGCSSDRIGVKATTEEHLGFTGRKEGIAAHAVCLLLKKTKKDGENPFSD